MKAGGRGPSLRPCGFAASGASLSCFLHQLPPTNYPAKGSQGRSGKEAQTPLSVLRKSGNRRPTSHFQTHHVDADLRESGKQAPHTGRKWGSLWAFRGNLKLPRNRRRRKKYKSHLCRHLGDRDMGNWEIGKTYKLVLKSGQIYTATVTGIDALFLRFKDLHGQARGVALDQIGDYRELGGDANETHAKRG